MNKRFVTASIKHETNTYSPIAADIVECAGAGVTKADLSVYR